jgi:CheY-like chemotaxis protein
MNDRPATLLLVEDNEDDAILIRSAFESAGIDCDLQLASDGESAISYLKGEGVYSDRAHYALPSVVLLDLTLPGKSGHDVLAWIAQQKGLRNLIRVVLTGSDNPADMDKAYRLGAHGYLTKPLTADQLLAPGRTLKMVLMSNGLEPRSRIHQPA